MDENLRPFETLREGLLNLFNPVTLATTPLATYLVGRGVSASGTAIAEFLLSAIESLRPPDAAPPQSHGWRCYRYLQLRYADCQSHTAVTQDLGISLRQASRVHVDALGLLARALSAPEAKLTAPASTSPGPMPADAPSRSDAVPDLSDAQLSLDAELATVASLRPEGGVSVAEVVQGVRDTFRHFATAHRVEVERELPSDLPPVRVNRIALRQILFNLLVYLVTAARDRHEREYLTIRLSGQQSGSTVTLSLWCNVQTTVRYLPPDGPGVELSSRTELPLSAARFLARAQGVSIEELDCNRLFPGLQVTLPIGARNVLLIDDNPDVGNLFRRMLTTSAYEIVHTRTSSRALAVARENAPQAILLDVIMPTHDGWEILTTLKRDRRTIAIPVIVCSVLPDRELALSLGATDFLAKPVTRAILLNALDRAFAVQSTPHTHQSP